MTGGVFFFDTLGVFLGPPVGGGRRFLEEMGEIEEKDRVDYVNMIFQNVLNTIYPTVGAKLFW